MGILNPGGTRFNPSSLSYREPADLVPQQELGFQVESRRKLDNMKSRIEKLGELPESVSATEVIQAAHDEGNSNMGKWLMTHYLRDKTKEITNYVDMYQEAADAQIHVMNEAARVGLVDLRLNQHKIKHGITNQSQQAKMTGMQAATERFSVLARPRGR